MPISLKQTIFLEKLSLKNIGPKDLFIEINVQDTK